MSWPGGHPSDTLPDYAAGRMEDTSAIGAHVNDCAECRREVEVLRALAQEIGTPLSPVERESLYSRIGRPRQGNRAWLTPTWRAVAAVALVATTFGVWQIDRLTRSDWNPTAVLQGWEADLVDLRLNAEDVQMALGIDIASSETEWEAWDPRDATQVGAPGEEN